MIPVIPRERAHQDVEEILSYYDSQAGEIISTDFVRELSLAQMHVSKFPKTGSTRLCEKASLPGIRVWSLKKYPHQIFYRIEAGRLDVWRILHSRRDINQDSLGQSNHH